MRVEGELPSLRVDPEADAAHLIIQDRDFDHAVPVGDSIIVNYDANGEAIGVELIGFGLESEAESEEAEIKGATLSRRRAKKEQLALLGSCFLGLTGIILFDPDSNTKFVGAGLMGGAVLGILRSTLIVWKNSKS